MKAKTIQNILQKKFEAWLESIPEDETYSGTLQLRAIIKENSIITGGAIVSMLMGEKVNDYDIYFRNEDTAAAVAEYYVSRFKKENPDAADIRVVRANGRVRVMVKSAGIASSEQGGDYQFFEALEPGSPEQEGFIEQATEALKKTEQAKKGEYKPAFLTSNALTLSDKVQLIIRFYGEPDEIHKNYDFVHCTNYWTSWDNKLVLRKDALQSILAKELIYQGSLYPLCSLFRLRKFIAKGWTINAGQVLKVVMQLGELDLMNLAILEEQLIGVDIAYMRDLINRLRDAKKNKVDIDRIYICQLIDEIF